MASEATGNLFRICYYLVYCDIPLEQKLPLIKEYTQNDFEELYSIEGQTTTLMVQDITSLKLMLTDEIINQTVAIKDTIANDLLMILTDENILGNYIKLNSSALEALKIDMKTGIITDKNLVVDDDFIANSQLPVAEMIVDFNIKLDADTKKIIDTTMLQGLIELHPHKNYNDIKLHANKSKQLDTRRLIKQYKNYQQFPTNYKAL